ncbi:MAG: methyltransferase domain-containing protein [Chloroflexota bacterium]
MKKSGRTQTNYGEIQRIGRRSFGVPARTDQPELLDQSHGSLEDVSINLSEIWRINRYLGGIKALTCHLYPLLQQQSKPTRVVDIGAGSGEIGLLLARWAERNMFRLAVSGLDRSQRNLSVSSADVKSKVSLIQADACALPFSSNDVDYFISSLFLHHLSVEQVVGVLRETYARCRRGIVMSDLVRGYLPLVAFRVIQPFFARHYLTRYDGMVSIKRAFTPDELLTLAHAAGIDTAMVYSHFPWRMTLVAEKPRV